MIMKCLAAILVDANHRVSTVSIYFSTNVQSAISQNGASVGYFEYDWEANLGQLKLYRVSHIVNAGNLEI